MDTGYRPIYSFYFRILATCLTFLTFLGVEAYALDNRFGVIAPYWQSDSTSYTFIAVSHPSLSNMASQIGVKVNALKKDNATFSTAASFTISSGTTQRVFIVRTGHSIINPTIIPSGVFIAGTTDYTYGSIVIEPIASNPLIRTSELWMKGNNEGYRDVTMLSFFGGIVFDASTTGFAMEFIGDVHDSSDIYNGLGQPKVVSGVN
ncbi:uncharacterized protein METZ01_LOCUS316757 [marine metagenome]|uniref:Uncharacterized protein n=1 Tax=marine metagenome TaxID=408172 RepID=A0A382NRT9_9ZZZZ